MCVRSCGTGSALSRRWYARHIGSDDHMKKSKFILGSHLFSSTSAITWYASFSILYFIFAICLILLAAWNENLNTSNFPNANTRHFTNFISFTRTRMWKKRWEGKIIQQQQRNSYPSDGFPHHFVPFRSVCFRFLLFLFFFSRSHFSRCVGHILVVALLKYASRRYFECDHECARVQKAASAHSSDLSVI